MSVSKTRAPQYPRAHKTPSLFQAAAVLGLSVSLAFTQAAGARDILRASGSGTGAGSQGHATAGGTNAPGSVAAAQAGRNAKDMLARSTQAVQAVNSMQAAARALSQQKLILGLDPSHPGANLPPVPNGLAVGGLQLAPGVPKDLAQPKPGEDSSLWVGARLPVQSKSGDQVSVVIKQTKPQALLTWETFNVGKNTDVYFNQTAGSRTDGSNGWIAVNRIVDPSGVPSQILGSIHGEGTVYLINPNGIIFGGNSQVNLHSFVASALPINDNLLKRGLLDNPDSQFLFTALAQTAGPNGTPGFSPLVTDPLATVSSTSPTLGAVQPVAVNSSGAPVTVRVSTLGGNVPVTMLSAPADYTATVDDNHKLTLTFTDAGLAKIGAANVQVAYQPEKLKVGNVTVQAGARLSSPTTPAHVGGRVALVGANVTNRGTISTPDGQTILAGGLQVGVAAHSASDPSLRGLDVFVGSVSDAAAAPFAGTAGSATNAGLIDAPRAEVTITGRSVNQLGVINASTSVTLNGRIDLLANYGAMGNAKTSTQKAGFAFSKTGAVTLGAGSATQILPELESVELNIGSELPLPSLVQMQGLTIHLGSNALVYAPNANLAPDSGTVQEVDGSGLPLTAGISFSAGRWTVSTNGPSAFFHDAGQIYLDAGASVYAAGAAGTEAKVSENILTLQLRGAELANSPLQREGLIRATDLLIDIRQTGTLPNGLTWQGTPLGDVSGFANLIQRPIGELAIAGGTVSLAAGSSVVLQRGSSIDVTGGYIDYHGEIVRTTRLLTQGQLVDISQASAGLAYDGIYTATFTRTAAKYGIVETFTSPLALTGAHYEPGYVFGGNGGSISITAPSVALDGDLRGQTVAGPRQRGVAAGGGITGNAPLLSSLTLDLEGSTGRFNSALSSTIQFTSGESQAPADPFQTGAEGLPVPLREDRRSRIDLSPDLVAGAGFAALTVIAPDSDFILPAGVTLQGQTRGGITLSGANIDLQGRIEVPGGTLAFTSFNFSPVDPSIAANGGVLPRVPDPNPARGHFVLGGSLSTAGLVVDDRITSSSAGTLQLATSAGSISIAAYTADLLPGSAIDVSGGVRIAQNGALSYGRGGTISIAAGQDPKIAAILGGYLNLGADLRGYSGAGGGALQIRAPRIQVGGTAPDSQVLLFSPDFFSRGGFSSFVLTGVALPVPGGAAGDSFTGLVIAPGTQIAPVAESVVALVEPDQSDVVFSRIIKPAGLRPTVSLSFNAAGVSDTITNTVIAVGDLIMGEGARIQVDPSIDPASPAKVSLVGSHSASVLGSVFAPGGLINVADGGATSVDTPTVQIGARSVLSTAGTTLLTPDLTGRGLRTGAVIAGGTITVSGNIVAEAGAVLDVSGASGMLDLAPAFSSTGPAPFTSLRGALAIPTRVDSSAGGIVLTGATQAFVDATLLGTAGGPSAFGGSLSIASGRYYDVSKPIVRSPLDVTLDVKQAGLTIPVPFHAPGETAIGHAVLGADGKAIPAMGYVSIQTFAGGGFDSIALGAVPGSSSFQGTVRFSGPVTLNANHQISLANAGYVYADSAVTIAAPYVQIGTAFLPPGQARQTQFPFFNSDGTPADGTPTASLLRNGHPVSGQLTVQAQLIDIGDLSLQGINRASFIAEQGDIRGSGTLDVAGEVALRAAQIYPPTELQFTVAAYDTGHSRGRVIISGSGVASLPLSAGGQLNVFGSQIYQGGTLRAPLGRIMLGSDSELKAPNDPFTRAAFQPTKTLVLAQGSTTSVSALDPVTGDALIVPYGFNLNDLQWIDPAGHDITLNGVPQKGVQLAGARVSDLGGSVIDLRGGGDLYAFRFVTGNGGTIDLLNPELRLTSTGPSTANQTFAIIPGYSAAYAPYAPFNTVASETNFNNLISPTSTGGAAFPDAGYTTMPGVLRVGDQVYLGASDGLQAGVYTLLPARYALQPGAFLVTPQRGMPLADVLLPEGASVVAGYRMNGLLANSTSQPLVTRFEVAPQEVIRNRALYQDYSANTFLAQRARDNDIAPDRLPMDAGHVIFSANPEGTASGHLNVQGIVQAQADSGGKGGLVDLTTDGDIVIDTTGASRPGNGAISAFSAGELSSFQAGSVLIGGYRTTQAPGVSRVTVTTQNLTLDNAGSPLSGSDLVLVARGELELANGASIRQEGSLAGGAETLLFGSAGSAGSGNGTLIRVSADPGAAIIRAGIDQTAGPNLVISSGAALSGAGVILDSTYAASLAPNALVHGQQVSIDAGQISIQLDSTPVTQSETYALNLSGSLLRQIGAAQALSLLSYSSIDVYGSGNFGSTALGSLSLHAGSIRGFAPSGGSAEFTAGLIALDNTLHVAAPGVGATSAGSLAFNAASIVLGEGRLNIDQYSSVALNAPAAIRFRAHGQLMVQEDLVLTTASISGARGAVGEIAAVNGDLTIQAPSNGTGAIGSGGLGASLTLSGQSVTENSTINLPSGSLKIEATTGNLTVGGNLNAPGTVREFYDVTAFTSGGRIALVSDHGMIELGAGSALSVAALDGANAGSLTITVPEGQFSIADQVKIKGTGGLGGTFALDAGSLSSTGSLGTLAGALAEGGFVRSISIRDRLDQTVTLMAGDVLRARALSISADHGLIDIAGTLDASGPGGGVIKLAAVGDVVLESGSKLTVAALDGFNAAGKGGSITLESGAETQGQPGSGTIRILDGSTLDLSVSQAGADGTVVALAPNATLGESLGTLHLRAPQISANGGLDVQIDPLVGSITPGAGIVIEGYQTFLAADGSVDGQKAAVSANASAFMSGSGAVLARLTGANSGIDPTQVNVRPGAEIINPGGDLTLASNWDLSTLHFGASSSPVNLTLRAAGNLIFTGALSDGFAGATATAGLLPAGSLSSSYRLVAGADFGAADFRRVLPFVANATAGMNGGSLKLGVDGGDNVANGGLTGTTAQAMAGHFQVIRTGTGDIEIATQGDVQLLNQFATIYTAGSKAASIDPNIFTVPRPTGTVAGSSQGTPAFQLSFGGGDVSIDAGGDVIHLTQRGGVYVADSERELPNNWLLRRGYVDDTGFYGTYRTDRNQSTTWWIDYGNFFEGIGALGGGNVALRAGRDISNVDAVVPTNAYMPYAIQISPGQYTTLRPAAANLIEFGGGNLTVEAGRNIDAGVYYVEKGRATLTAGGSIITNATRTPTVYLPLTGPSKIAGPETWLPTTLFLGKGGFDVSAGGDVLLGPVANPFLLPAGIRNGFLDKTYFSTYATTDFVNVTSLAGDIAIRASAVVPTSNAVDNIDGSAAADALPAGATSLLAAWLLNQQSIQTDGTSNSAAYYQPWLRLSEIIHNTDTFVTAGNLMPATLRATAFAGNILLQTPSGQSGTGGIILSPSPTGTLDLLAAGSILGLQPDGQVAVTDSANLIQWGYARINVSDANPLTIPTITAPLAYLNITGAGISQNALATTPATPYLTRLDSLFAESGSTDLTLDVRQALHSADVLHAGDPYPIHLYADGGISGYTLFASKVSRLIAGRDVTDVSLYLQNVVAGDISVVAAGRDLLPNRPNSPLRLQASSGGNVFDAFGATQQPGDVQVGGPGTVEILAGRNFETGQDPGDSASGVGLGVTTIGNARNPFLAFDGADIVIAAGVGLAAGLEKSTLDLAKFSEQLLTGPESARYLAELASVTASSQPLTAEEISKLPAAERDVIALQLFYLVLRDSGRDHNLAGSSGFGTYAAADSAIATLFPRSLEAGDINLTGREIKTGNGGDISLLAPAGEVIVGVDQTSSPAADQGILTASGGNISIYSQGGVSLGVSRIFTLRGGNIMIFSAEGDIAAGAASKTVLSAPPTRVLIDPQTGDVRTDLAGLATGGGIGVLESVAGVAPGDVDLIAPNGVIDAGDAGIRSAGNLNLAATQVLNAGNIAVTGSTAGAPSAPAVSAPSISSIAAASSAAGATSSEASNVSQQSTPPPATEEPPSIISVEIELGEGTEELTQ